jgi:hypothetical protein
MEGWWWVKWGVETPAVAATWLSKAVDIIQATRR